MMDLVENNLDVKWVVVMEDKNVVEKKQVQVSYKNIDDFHYNHIEQVVEEFEDFYLVVVVHNDTSPVVEMDGYKVYLDRTWNKMNYNRLNMMKRMMLMLQDLVVKPNLYHGVVVEDLSLRNVNDVVVVVAVVDDEDDLICLFSDVNDDYSWMLNDDYSCSRL
jgi:hypothetical protein